MDESNECRDINKILFFLLKDELNYELVTRVQEGRVYVVIKMASFQSDFLANLKVGFEVVGNNEHCTSLFFSLPL